MKSQIVSFLDRQKRDAKNSHQLPVLEEFIVKRHNGLKDSRWSASLFNMIKDVAQLGFKP